MADPDPPGFAARGQTPSHDIAASVDAVVAAAGCVDLPGGLLDRPALDETRRVEAAVRPVPAGIEGAARSDRQVLAGGDDVADVGAGVSLAELATHQSADLAIGLVRAEAGIDVMKTRDDLTNDLVSHQRRLKLDADGRPHHVLDPAQAAGDLRAHPRPA